MPRQLNERQQQVLQWVGRGCPDGIWEGTAHKLSCQALQNRGLVKVSKRQGQWSAVLTDAGQHYLDHSAAAQRDGIQLPAGTSDPESNARVASPLPTQRTSSLPRKRAKTVTEQLLEELIEAGGRIVKREASGRETEKWPIRVAAARRSGKIPETKELHAGWCGDGYEIRLVDTPAWRLAVLPPIPVPIRLTAPHPVVKALQGHPQPMRLTKSVQGRAFHLIHGLLTATQSLGYASALGTAESAPATHRRRDGPPHFTIPAEGQRCDFLILQEQDRTEHIPTKKELADAEKQSWVRIPRHDHSPAERLRICVSGGLRHRADEWADTAARPLEDQLAEIVQEVGLRGQAAERKRLADREEVHQKRLRWEAVKRQATAEYAEAYRARHLEAQNAAWRRAAGLVEYVGALRLHAESLPLGPAKDEAEAWIAWAEGHVHGLNPLNGSPLTPEIPEPRAEDLKPFMHGLSPYGPSY
ncbi:hypothetical protein OG304_06965 [Streptomyces sp. NBC_00160]|uniref:hypothetical protein n=1 Tax=Streptomyces sp. NBC_00160 TaxID=2903628 RepID=UPI0022558298|nr:hypothetical protein [Streptomyces sp. NBC_00160]MCX5303192.1 hypothetical protein [Streptomyces sp. NBC_00160]